MDAAGPTFFTQEKGLAARGSLTMNCSGGPGVLHQLRNEEGAGSSLRPAWMRLARPTWPGPPTSDGGRRESPTPCGASGAGAIFALTKKGPRLARLLRALRPEWFRQAEKPSPAQNLGDPARTGPLRAGWSTASVPPLVPTAQILDVDGERDRPHCYAC